MLEKWHILKEKIHQAANLRRIHEEMDYLRKNFDHVQSQFGQVDPYDSYDLTTLKDKMFSIEVCLLCSLRIVKFFCLPKVSYLNEVIISCEQNILSQLTSRKQNLQALNEASLGTQLYLKDTCISGDVREQLQELYALYEENYQL